MKKSILIVDDISKNLQLVGNLLKTEGYKVYIAQSGKAVLKNINKTTYDLILLDVMMPEMDGFEVCIELKKNKKSKNTPIIFLTAKDDAESVTRGFDLGGVDYITKPFNSKELLSRVKTHITIQNQKTKLIELNATKDKLFSIIGHDLRGPIGGLKTFIELLTSNYDLSDTQRLKKTLESMQIAANSTFELLENLLSWASSQKNEIIFAPEKTKLKELIQHLIDLFYKLTENKGISIIDNTVEDMHVYADKNMLMTILRNLISNAIKFTPHEKNIYISAEKNENENIITIKDEGVGIKEENRSKLFKKNDYFTSSGTDNEKGSGLGLILCKDFIEKHNGKIWIESEIGKGSEFNFTLPKSMSLK